MSRSSSRSLGSIDCRFKARVADFVCRVVDRGDEGRGKGGNSD